jgi:hypothetical protein
VTPVVICFCSSYSYQFRGDEVVDGHVTNTEVALAVAVDHRAVTGGPAVDQTQHTARVLKKGCEGGL